MTDEKLIYLYACSDISTGGGFQTYVSTLANYGMPGVSKNVLTSLEDFDRSQLKLLHVQEEMALINITGEFPSIFTVHNHTPYCPSGTKYFPTSQQCCTRSMSVLGCTWGHLIDGCGSRRPQNIVHKISSSYRLLEKLKQLRIPVIANSDYVRDRLIENGLPAHQTVTLRCGTPLPKTVTAPLTLEVHKNQRILFAGRIVPDKGLEWLLKALAQTDRSIHLDIAGEGWDRPRMEKLVNRLKLNDRVTWHGWCNSEQMDALYQQCFAIIFPSVWPEPAGLITLEAYARYRSVIAGRVGGIPEHLLHEETGILVPINDIKQLAAAITDLSTNYHKSRLLGQQGHDLLLKEFTMDVHVKKLQQIYEKAIDCFLDRTVLFNNS
ncbi:MAG: glycosyltransferase family 4 protein [Microcoleus sp.]